MNPTKEISQTPSTTTTTADQESATCSAHSIAIPNWRSRQLGDQSIELTIALPGVNKNDLEVIYESKKIKIKAPRKQPPNSWKIMAGKAFPDLYQIEFDLKEEVDEKNITGNLNKGILTVVIPPISGRCARRIPLN